MNYKPDKPQAEYTLEDWYNYHSTSCECVGTYKCSGCTMRELEENWWTATRAERDSHQAELQALEESWRKTLAAERSSYLALNRRYAATKEKLDALERNASERP